MKVFKLKFPEKLEPYKGVILFAVVLMLSNFFWKYNVLGDESCSLHSKVTFWGIDISKPFVWMAVHVAGMSRDVLNFLGSEVSLNEKNTLSFANGNSVNVIWACTGLKQTYICFCILLFARGSLKNKIWYVPLSLLVVYLFNIFRIATITGTIENHPQWFEVLHLYIFKYLFYGVIFLLWLIWEEKIAGAKPKIEKVIQP